MSGELKHGPLAMVDSNRGIVMIICRDKVYKVSFSTDNDKPRHLRKKI